MRQLSPSFMEHLSSPEGILHPILTRVKNDDTLMLAIRDNHINIYYRGGSLLRVAETAKGTYQTRFDEHYGWGIKHLPRTICDQKESMDWAVEFPFLKNTMDGYFAAHKHSEREFQQVVFRENNNSSISDHSDYFITDIECADMDLRAKIDMLAVCWPARQRFTGSLSRPVLIEMKYGDGSLGGESGLLKHLRDFDALVRDREKYRSLLEMMESQFRQLCALGLLNFKVKTEKVSIRLDPNARPEVIFLLANHTPSDGKLLKLLESSEVRTFEDNPYLDLRFYVANFAGYGLFPNCMLPLSEFRALLRSVRGIYKISDGNSCLSVP